MKLLVEKELKATFVARNIEFTTKLLQHYAVSYKQSGYTITIYKQKIVLDEVDMNILFYEVLNVYFKVTTITYAPLGGAGCEFTVAIK